MKDIGVFLVAGAIGVVILCAAVVSGYWNARHMPAKAAKVAIGSPVSERQIIERRRGRAADVAVAASTM